MPAERGSQGGDPQGTSLLASITAFPGASGVLRRWPL